MKYNFNISTDIEIFARGLIVELRNQQPPFKNSHVLEAISRMHGHKNWNTYRAFIKKNNNRPHFVQAIKDDFNKLNHETEYNFSVLSDVKHFSYAFRKHLMNGNLISLSDALNLIALCMGCKNWITLKAVLYERQKRINNINQILNKDSCNMSCHCIKEEYLNDPIYFFKDLIINRDQDGQHLWWGRSLSILETTLDSLLILKQKKLIELDINILKENMYLEKYIQLSKNKNIDCAITNNIETHLTNFPGYKKNEQPNTFIKEQYEFLLTLIFKVIDEYIYYGQKNKKAS